VQFLLTILYVAFLASSNIFANNIFDAIESNDFKKIENLIKKEKININKTDEYGNTPLILACLKSNIKIVELLIAHDANPNIPDKKVLSALFWAFHNYIMNNNKNNLAIIRLLLKHGADPNIIDKIGGTTFHYVCHCEDNLKEVQLLLEYGADLTIVNNNGETPADCAKNDKETQHYLESVCDLDKQKNKAQVIKNLKKEKERNNIFRLLFFRSTKKVLDQYISFQKTEIYKVYNDLELRKLMKKYFFLKKRRYGFYNILLHTIDRNKSYFTDEKLNLLKKNKKLSNAIKDKENQSKDFLERINYIVENFL